MIEFKTPKIKLPKVNVKQVDWSKWNPRKLNWLTVVTVFSYLNVLVLIPTLFMKKSAFAQYHARQGLALLVVTVLFSFTFYLPLLPWVFAVFILVCIIAGILNVVMGRERPLPVIGKYAK